MDEPRHSVLITFRRKDTRKDPKTDKVKVFKKLVKTQIKFHQPGRIKALPKGPRHKLGFDINRFEAPILIAKLTDSEIAVVRKHPDVKRVSKNVVITPNKASKVLSAETAAANAAVKLQAAAAAGRPQRIPSGVQRIGAPAAWRFGRGAGVKVAVLDCGVDAMHKDLKANCRPGTNTDFEATVRFSHGTRCAGTIAAVDDEHGIVGVAPEAQIFPVKVGPFGAQLTAVVAGIDWCIAHGIHIVNMSFEVGNGGGAPELEAICKLAEKHGILLVASSGNIDVLPEDESTALLPAPARYASVLAVSAVDALDRAPGFSGRGPKVELCAPGTNVVSTLLGNRYGTDAGSTSCAAPHVTGAAAVVWSVLDEPTNKKVRQILIETADPLGSGRPNPKYGFGLVNVERAVQRARELNKRASPS